LYQLLLKQFAGWRRAKPWDQWSRDTRRLQSFALRHPRHFRMRPIIFTTNKPLNEWGKVLRDEDVAAVSSTESWNGEASSASMDPPARHVI
jgi:hypothetical protein